MRKLSDLNADFETVGRRVMEIVDRVGFGVLPKGDWDAELLGILIDALPELQDSDSFRRAEILGLTDQRYRTLYSKIAMRRTGPGTDQDDVAIIREYLGRVLQEWRDEPESSEVRIVVDDELKRRNLMRALERAETPVELSITGHSVVMKRTGLDRLLDRLKNENALPAEFAEAMSNRNRRERRRAIADALREAGTEVITQLALQIAAGVAT